MTPAEIARQLANVPRGAFILTNDGLVYDHVRYRFNQSAIGTLLDNNHHRTPIRKRLQVNGKIEVSIRVWDGDIDKIEVLDPQTGEYHQMWSTDPEYTGGLSRWEHHLYRDLLKAEGRGGALQKNRINAKSKQKVLMKYDQELHAMGFRERAKAVALMEAEERRQETIDAAASARMASTLTPDEFRSWEVAPGGEGREDIPAPPPQGRMGRRADIRHKAEHVPPERKPNWGRASTAHLARDDGTSTPDPEREDSSNSKSFKFKTRKC
ncbi:hypothetical protein ACSMXM_05000 [Pacificimonas sp. ICDLI1SI03]